MRVLGLDPGLRRTGWGVIESEGPRLRFVAAGCIAVAAEPALAARLADLHRRLAAVCGRFAPDEAAVEEPFVNRNPASTLKLGSARGAVLLAPGLAGIPVTEYAPNAVKKSVTGAGHATKEQVRAMMAMLLPGYRGDGTFDAADALAVAVCHTHLRETARRWTSRTAGAVA